MQNQMDKNGENSNPGGTRRFWMFVSDKRGLMTTLFVLMVLLVLWGSMMRSDAADEKPKELESQPIKIGFSQLETDNPWRTAQINSFKDAIVPGRMKFLYDEPEEYTTEWQVENAQRLLDEGVDYLVIAPHEVAPFAPVLQSAKKLDVPVILIEREAQGVPKEDYMTLISTDYVREGQLCAQMLAEKFGDQECNVVELYGAESSPVARARSAGFRQQMQQYPNMHILSVAFGNFDRVTAQKAMENTLIRLAETGRRVDAVFAHSDEDGLGALQALKVAGMRPGKDVFIVSVNGVQDVCKAIIAGEYLGTVESNPKWGQIVVMLIQMNERGARPFPSVITPYRIIDATNAEKLLPLAY